MEDASPARRHRSWGSLQMVGAATSPSPGKRKGSKVSKRQSAPGRCQQVPQAGAPGRRGHAGLCAGQTPGRWPGHHRGTRQSGWGHIARVADIGSRASASPLPGLALPQRELRVCAAPLASARCPVPGRATLGPISVCTRAITILPGSLRLSAMRPKPEWAYNKQIETTRTLATMPSPRGSSPGRGQKSPTSMSLSMETSSLRTCQLRMFGCPTQPQILMPGTSTLLWPLPV